LLPLLVRVVLVEDAVAAVASSVAARDAAVVVVSSVVRDVVAAKAVASSAVVAVAVRVVDVARVVVVEAAAVRPSTSPTQVPSPAWAHRTRQHSSRPEDRTCLCPSSGSVLLSMKRNE